MIKTVAIFGDSWAYSSFKKLPNMQEETDNLKFQDLFDERGIKASNYAIQGGTNLDTISQLSKYGKNYDLCIVFQTDPIRQNFVQNNVEYILNESIHLPVATNLNQLAEILLEDFYQEINSLGIPILLIGGCTKLCFDRIPDTINTLPLSWTELMVPDFKDHYYYWIDDTIKVFDKANKENNWGLSLSDFFDYEKQIMEKNAIWQTSDDFSWCHAAIPAYKRMFEEIMETI